MIGGAKNPYPITPRRKGTKGLRSSRKASKRIYDTATIVALKGRGPEREPAIRSALGAVILIGLRDLSEQRVARLLMSVRDYTPRRSEAEPRLGNLAIVAGAAVGFSVSYFLINFLGALEFYCLFKVFPLGQRQFRNLAVLFVLLILLGSTLEVLVPQPIPPAVLAGFFFASRMSVMLWQGLEPFYRSF